jgi:serine protease AprX
MWDEGQTGAGVDIAVIDTGVAEVKGLKGKVITGMDISLDSPYTAVDGVDAFGHGTNMASIAAGLDPAADGVPLDDKDRFVGVAPGARIVNVKVGAFDGSSDVTQILSAIDWVIQNRHTNGLNIRVLNLSYGTPTTLSSHDDPVSWAAEVAWRKGIVVVASAGNDGVNTKLVSPAINPRIIAVGAVDQSKPLAPTFFTNLISKGRMPDLWAPGQAILGLRVPGGFLESRFPASVQGSRLMRGSGTSQAAAVVSGAAALLAGAFPDRNPDQIRLALDASGKDVTGAMANFVQVDKAAELLAKLGKAPYMEDNNLFFGQGGKGSLEASRGVNHISSGGIALTGEKDIFGNPFSTANWSAGSWAGVNWTGANWTGANWTGANWTGANWTGANWTGANWTGANWTGANWTGSNWLGAFWG